MKWIEDWFGSEYYSLLYQHRGVEEARAFLDKLIGFLKIPPGGRIIDCGCGKGRHSICLRENGFDVTGIDLSEQNISCSKKSEKNNLVFFTHDLRNLFRINYYDAALSLFTSFGYFEKDTENNKVIRSIASALKKGGWLVLDYMNVEKETRKLCPEEKTEIGKITFRINRSAVNGCISKEIHVHHNGRIRSYHENVKAYKRSHLENFFTKNGLEVVHLFGGYDLRPFDEHRSDRLILLGQKK